MTEQAKNQAVLARFFEMAGQGDVPGALALIDETCVWTYSASTDFIPFAGTFHGREGVLAFFQGAAEHVRIERMEIDRVETFGDTLIVRGRETSTAHATGETFEAQWLHLVRIKHGLITRYDEYVDSAVIARGIATLAKPEA